MEKFWSLIKDQNFRVDDMLNEYYVTPLLLAIERDNLKMVYLLLNKNANTRIPNKAGVTPIIMAIDKGNQKIIDLLLKKDPTILDDKKDFALMLATKKII